MNNDINIVIKSQGQPDEGEGHSEWQAVHGNVYGEEGLSANVRGDAQVPRSARQDRARSEPDHLVRRSRIGTSLHHKTKSSIHHMRKGVD